MSSYNALWSRHGDGAFTPHPEVRNGYFEAATVTRASRGGEAIGLGFQSTADYFGFARCVDGAVVRQLEFDGSSGWMTVDGTPEPWEAELLFAERELARQRELVDPSDRPRLEEVLHARTIELDSPFPLISADALVRSVARWYGLTTD